MTEKLTDDRVFEIYRDCREPTLGWALRFARAIEREVRDEVIEELCLELWDVRSMTGEISSDQVGVISDHFRSLKTTPTAASREES
ncbi:hypothetical protein X986_3895 [Burkholderia pseudomallei]|uniref:hypothetical protein n=1 Tax=Burkholderia pseudomallei TaxID=28450 RepID=UPI000537740E|nr:hypothetical protein [Burkholderia pseudomallei]KGX26166.1 hypothetical protein X986_3895 [Burkholderia pseudomallei]